jgi:hypothetical protein
MAVAQELLREVNEEVTGTHGRITLHVFVELTSGIIPNFCYNSATKRY